MTTTLNPSDKSANVTLTASNLQGTATSTSAYQGVRSTTSKVTTGKYYWEATVNSVGGFSGGAMMLGVGVAAQSLSSGFVGDSTLDGFAYSINGSGIIINGSTDVGYNLGAVSVNDVFCFAIDIAAKDFWVRRNAGNWNNNFGGTANPSTGAFGLQAHHSTDANTIFGKGAMFVLPEFFQNSQCTVNFGATAFAQSVPSGYTAWDSGSVTGTIAQTLQKVTQSASGNVTGVAGTIAQTLQKVKQTAGGFVLPAAGNTAFSATWTIG